MPKRAAPLPEIKLELHGEEEEVYEEDFEKTGVIYQAPGSPYKNGCLEEEEDFSHSSYNDTDDGQDEEFFATNIEVPDPSIDFLEKCHGLGLDPNSQVLLTSWELYFRASQQVLLEGDPNAWKAAAIYYYLLNRGIKLIGKLPKVLCVAFPFEAGRILTIFNISAIELFDKVARFTEILSTRKTRRIAEFTRRNQESLALSSVVFKKFLPIFRRLFCLVKEDEASKSTNPVSTSQLFSLIWVSYLMMKRFLPNEELLNDFQLLLCIIDAIYCDMCQTSLDVHFNNDFAQDLLNRSETVLEALCSEFDGAILEAKLFRENFYWKRHTWSWLPDRWDVVENCAPGGLLDRLNETYNTLLLRRGQLDERLFVPDNIELVFDEAYDESAVEVLKRGPDNRVFEDAQLLMTISAQNCLERVTEGKFTKPLEYTRNCTMPIDKLCNSTLLGEQHNIEILKDFVAEFQLDTSSLKKFSQGFPESPLNLIIEFYDQFQAELLQRVEDDNKWDPNFDTDFSDGLSENLELLKSLYLRFVDLVVVTEVERGTLNIYILGVLKRKEFAKCIYVAALELVLFANSSQRQFPWSAQTCGLEPFVFHRIIDVILLNETDLPRPLVDHLNQVEERILEELGWLPTSNIWVYVLRTPLSRCPPFDESFFDIDSTPLFFTPLKKSKLDDDFVLPREKHNDLAIPKALKLFLRRILYIASVRLNDLCERIKMDESVKPMVWTLFDHILRNETSLMECRHLDQNLLCCVYVITKIAYMEITFTDIMAHYRRQPQANSRVYREVSVQSLDDATQNEDSNSRDSALSRASSSRGGVIPPPGVNSAPPTPDQAEMGDWSRVDIIKYYNEVFRVRVEDFVMQMDAKKVEILPMPVPKAIGASPFKKQLTSRVLIQTLQKGSFEINYHGMLRKVMSFSLQRSPRKDLMALNKKISMIHTARKSPIKSTMSIKKEMA